MKFYTITFIKTACSLCVWKRYVGVVYSMLELSKLCCSNQIL